MTPVDVVNNALDQIKRPRIASFYDGSAEALVALDIYSETRDELFHHLAPDWSRGDAQLVVVRQAPTDFYQTTPWDSTFPPLPWLFEYAFPNDCVNPLQIKPTLSTPLWRPRYIPFRLNADPITHNNSILCNEPNAILSYTRQVNDPNIWHNDFTQVVIAALVQKFAREEQQPNADQARRHSEQSPG